MFKIFTEWPFWVMVGLFILSVVLMLTVESLSTNKDTLWPLLGVIPAAYIWYRVFVKPTINK